MIKFTWHETKRNANLSKHGIDFVDVHEVFEGLTYTFEDDRFEYNEQRFVTLGVLNNTPVSIIHTENCHEIHIISTRKATKREIKIYRESTQT
jgi:uncharacterized protein